MIGKLVFVPYLLNLQVAPRMLQLFLDRDHLMSLADADPEKIGKRRHHLLRLFILSVLAQPRDSVQRIIEEMRIDLCLKRFQLCLSQTDLLLPHLLHQALDPEHHMPERF